MNVEEEDRMKCPIHGEMYLFEKLRRALDGAIREYRCEFCSYSDTFMVLFVPRQKSLPAP